MGLSNSNLCCSRVNCGMLGSDEARGKRQQRWMRGSGSIPGGGPVTFHGMDVLKQDSQRSEMFSFINN